MNGRNFYYWCKVVLVIVLAQIFIWKTLDFTLLLYEGKLHNVFDTDSIDYTNSEEEDKYFESKNVHSFESVRHREHFCVFPNVVKAKGRDSKLPMILHTSANYFGDNLVKMAKKWDGRISLAVYASSVLVSQKESDSSVNNVISKLWSLVSCNYFLSESLDGHIFVNWNTSEPCPTVEIETIEEDESSKCSTSVTPLDAFPFETITGTYPVNTARNIARMYQASDFFLIADMDQEYSAGAEEILRNLTTLWDIKERKWALTVRRFEYREDTLPPRNLSALQEGLDDRNVFEFHSRFWPEGHSISGLNSWVTNQVEGIHVVDIKKGNNVRWEPMFVVDKLAPWHNEEMLYGLVNHVSMVTEMCCAGYTFAIAPEVFSVHRGTKVLPTLRHLSARAEQTGEAARKLFYLKLAQQYPKTAEQCLKSWYPK